MENSRLKDLFEKCIEKLATADERDALFAMMLDTANEAEIQQLMTAAWDNFQPKKDVFSQDRSMALLNKILATGNTAKVVEMPSVTPNISWWRIAAAAVILLTIGVAAYLFVHPFKNIDQTIAQQTKYDVPPGGNKAVLTLSNGQTIVLDSANNGTLAQQGNAKVVKLSNGQLVYSSNGDAMNEVLYNTMRTPKGGQYQLALPDGTKVWLNASSSIRYPTMFLGSKRQVDITGEAYFEVAKNAAMPFMVKINNAAEVEVLGTHFNINAYTDEEVMKTTLLEGSVRIRNLSSFSRPVMAVLKPGQQAQLTPMQIKVVTDADTEEAMAWHNGLFDIKSLSIEALMRQITRWYDVEVVYEGTKPEGHFSGMVGRNTNLSSVLKILELNGVHYRLENKKIFIQP